VVNECIVASIPNYVDSGDSCRHDFDDKIMEISTVYSLFVSMWFALCDKCESCYGCVVRWICATMAKFNVHGTLSDLDLPKDNGPSKTNTISKQIMARAVKFVTKTDLASVCTNKGNNASLR